MFFRFLSFIYSCLQQELIFLVNSQNLSHCSWNSREEQSDTERGRGRERERDKSSAHWFASQCLGCYSQEPGLPLGSLMCWQTAKHLGRPLLLPQAHWGTGLEVEPPGLALVLRYGLPVSPISASVTHSATVLAPLLQILFSVHIIPAS